MEIPAAVRLAAEGREPRPVWLNELGGITFVAGSGHDPVFLKWAPSGSGIDLAAEARRLDWAAPYTTVPRVVDLTADRAGTLLVTSAIPGENAVAEPWNLAPGTAVGIIGEGLRRFHDALPTEGCPFSWAVHDRISTARRNAESGSTGPDLWHPEHRGLTLAEAMGILEEPPPVDRLVVCHGDACAPNTIIHDGRLGGYVDLGALGVADRWADLAIATWSTEWNYGPGWAAELLDAYGIEDDPLRRGYYRLLWDLT